MTEGPLNESEMAWLEETLISYGHDDASVLDVSELDGMFTAVLSGPVVVEPDTAGGGVGWREIHSALEKRSRDEPFYRSLL